VNVPQSAETNPSFTCFGNATLANGGAMTFESFIMSMLGRHMTWRVGRRLYCAARGDIGIDIRSDGEVMVQRQVLVAWDSVHPPAGRLVVFDVGANVGDWPVAMLDLCQDRSLADCRLYAFEPVSSTFSTYSSRIAEHRLGRAVTSERTAMSSREGNAKIRVVGDNAGRNSLHVVPTDQTHQVEEVTLTTIDSYCARRGIAAIHLLKIGTEGHDMEVLRGAIGMISSGTVSVIQFEYSDMRVAARNFLKDVFDLVEGLPYYVGRPQPDHVIVYCEWHPELERFFAGNYLLIHETAIPWFSVRRARPDHSNVFVEC
jgi:FkbM family methyltransferase